MNSATYIALKMGEMCKKKINFQTKYNQHVLILEYYMRYAVLSEYIFHSGAFTRFYYQNRLFRPFLTKIGDIPHKRGIFLA